MPAPLGEEESRREYWRLRATSQWKLIYGAKQEIVSM